MSTQKSFFASLFDFSFISLITPRVLRVLYALEIVLIVLDALFWAYVGLSLGLNFSTTVALAVALVAVPIFTLLYITAVRVQYEFFIVVFRILETNTERVRLARMGLTHKPSVPAFDTPAANAVASPSDASTDWASAV